MSLETLQVQSIPLSQIRPKPKQPRRVISQDDIDLMAASLLAIGQETPAKVRLLIPEERATSGEVEYELIGGHIRYAGAQKAGLTSLNCWVLNLTPAQAKRAALMDNQSTEMYWLDWVLEIDSLYNDMTEKSQRKLADELGLSQPKINMALKIANSLTSHSRTLLDQSLITHGPEKAISQHPIETLITLNDPQLVEKALPVVLDRNMTQPEVKRLVTHMKAGGDPAAFGAIKAAKSGPEHQHVKSAGGTDRRDHVPPQIEILSPGQMTQVMHLARQSRQADDEAAVEQTSHAERTESSVSHPHPAQAKTAAAPEPACIFQRKAPTNSN